MSMCLIPTFNQGGAYWDFPRNFTGFGREEGGARKDQLQMISDRGWMADRQAKEAGDSGHDRCKTRPTNETRRTEEWSGS